MAAHPSESNEVAVRGTSDDAIVSKLSASRMGYFEDPFLVEVVSPGSQNHRRSPLINRGYWARVAAVDQCLREFVEAYGGDRCQIISLGAGYDTTYFRLKHQGLQAKKFFEVDFADSCRRKAQLVLSRPLLKQTFEAPPVYAASGSPASSATQEDQQDADPRPQEPQADKEPPAADPAPQDEQPAAADGGGGDEDSGAMSASRFQRRPQFAPKLRLPPEGVILDRDDYALVGVDLRELADTERYLVQAGLDFTLPTLILSECVLVYMEPKYSDAVIAWMAKMFAAAGALFVTYEQIHPHDQFGQTMMHNLRMRGCPLLGLPTYPTIEAHRERYLKLGFQAHEAWTMNDIYAHYLPSAEVRRAERLELFDEFEEWHMLQGHYIISMAAINPPAAAAAAAQQQQERDGERQPAPPSLSGGSVGIIGRPQRPAGAPSRPVPHNLFRPSGLPLVE